MNMKGLYVIASIVLLSVMPFGLAAQEGSGLELVYDGQCVTLSSSDDFVTLQRNVVGQTFPELATRMQDCDTVVKLAPGDKYEQLIQLDSSVLTNRYLVVTVGFSDADNRLDTVWLKLDLEKMEAFSCSEKVKEAPVDAKKKEVPFHIILIGALVLICFCLVLFVRGKSRKNKAQGNANPGKQELQLVEDNTEHYDVGLKHVYSNQNDYLMVDLDEVFVDTAVKRVFFSHALVRKLYSFFSRFLEESDRTDETGCFILGCWDYESTKQQYDVSLEYFVEPGDDSQFGEYSLNFGKKIGVHMASVIEDLSKKSKRDYVQTCWMHSHPGLGLFLSNQDLVVQQQLAYSDHRNRMLAIVIDTNSADFKIGIFSAKRNGKMNNNEDVVKWFSFDDFYQQSRAALLLPKVNQPFEMDSLDPNYYYIRVNGDGIGRMGFSGKAINKMEDGLFSVSAGVCGYFFGKSDEGSLLIADYAGNYNEDALGCLIVDKELDLDAIVGKYADYVADSRFFVVYRDDKLIKICFVAVSDEGSLTARPVADISLFSMKEWIRRKRN